MLHRIANRRLKNASSHDVSRPNDVNDDVFFLPSIESSVSSVSLLVSSSASFSDDDDAKSVDLSRLEKIDHRENRLPFFFGSLFERANRTSNTSYVRRLGFAQTRFVVLALSRIKSPTKARVRVGPERPSESGVPVERPDESGQLERGTSGVCHSRRVGRGHRGRESGAVVSERANEEKRPPSPLETTGARIRKKKKKKKKKKIASCVFYSTHIIRGNTHQYTHKTYFCSRHALLKKKKTTTGVRSNAESRASMSTPLLPHRGGGVCPSKPNQTHLSPPPSFVPTPNSPKEEREKERH